MVWLYYYLSCYMLHVVCFDELFFIYYIGCLRSRNLTCNEEYELISLFLCSISPELWVKIHQKGTFIFSTNFSLVHHKKKKVCLILRLNSTQMRVRGSWNKHSMLFVLLLLREERWQAVWTCWEHLMIDSGTREMMVTVLSTWLFYCVAM